MGSKTKAVSIKINLGLAIKTLRCGIAGDPLAPIKDAVQSSVTEMLGADCQISLNLEPVEIANLFGARMHEGSGFSDVYIGLREKIEDAIFDAIDDKITDVLYGVYSAEADEIFGHYIYLNEAGDEVKVTALYESIDMIESKYNWADKKIVGKVLQLVKSSRKPCSAVWK